MHYSAPLAIPGIAYINMLGLMSLNTVPNQEAGYALMGKGRPPVFPPKQRISYGQVSYSNSCGGLDPPKVKGWDKRFIWNMEESQGVEESPIYLQVICNAWNFVWRIRRIYSSRSTPVPLDIAHAVCGRHSIQDSPRTSIRRRHHNAAEQPNSKIPTITHTTKHFYKGLYLCVFDHLPSQLNPQILIKMLLSTVFTILTATSVASAENSPATQAHQGSVIMYRSGDFLTNNL
ncbi:hypothetical protein EV426DRAFT_678262 [Tirmania nivea]|nr:hypothetical protein EV426DRAFT_678262 [Tirmania nivea]